MAGDHLLVSSTTRAVLWDVAKAQLTAVGSKPRDGRFGACFGVDPADIFAGRPNARLWRVRSCGAAWGNAACN